MAKSSPSKDDVALEKAIEAYQSGDFARVLRVYDLTPAKHRASPLWNLLVGAALCRQGRFSEAEPHLLRSIKQNPNEVDALTWLALIHAADEDAQVPLGFANQAVKLRPEDATCHSVLGQVHLKRHEPELALPSLQQAARIEPKSAIHWHNLAQCCLALQLNEEGLNHYRRAIELSKRDPQNYLALGSALSMFGFAGDAITCLSDGVKNCPENAQFHIALASCYTQVRNDDEAEFQHQQAIRIDKNSATAFGAWLVNQGRFEESNMIFEQAIKGGNDVPFSYYNLMLSRKLASNQENRDFIEAMEAILDSELNPKGEMYLRYALGRAAEQLSNFEEAALHFEEANRLAFELHKRGLKVPKDRFINEINEQIETYERLKAENLVVGNPSNSPIFIVGMIRSGTTLLDQIISSHSKVASGGELRFWLEESKKLAMRTSLGQPHHLDDLARDYLRYAKMLASSEDRFSDKMPLNYSCVGAMHLALPNAKFIHIRRNPIDICLSIWTTYFGQGPVFGYDKSRIMAAYRAYEHAMQFWHASLPTENLLEVSYEAIIQDPNTEVRRIIEFLGLDWEDACLRHDKNSSAINTPSRWQARQPIYSTSVERWRKYEPWLGEFGELQAWLACSSSA